MNIRFCLSTLAVGVIWGTAQLNMAAPESGVTLLGTLEEWKYPESKFGGANMSDGGNQTWYSVNCQAIMTTADSVEKVARYYADKFVSGPLKAEVAQGQPDAQSVATQDASTGRPLQLRVITINRSKSSTTLVISRANAEERTQIVWAHYFR